jgi:hypothetical protein
MNFDKTRMEQLFELFEQYESIIQENKRILNGYGPQTEVLQCTLKHLLKSTYAIELSIKKLIYNMNITKESYEIRKKIYNDKKQIFINDWRFNFKSCGFCANKQGYKNIPFNFEEQLKVEYEKIKHLEIPYDLYYTNKHDIARYFCPCSDIDHYVIRPCIYEYESLKLDVEPEPEVICIDDDDFEEVIVYVPKKQVEPVVEPVVNMSLLAAEKRMAHKPILKSKPLSSRYEEEVQRTIINGWRN